MPRRGLLAVLATAPTVGTCIASSPLKILEVSPPPPGGGIVRVRRRGA